MTMAAHDSDIADARPALCVQEAATLLGISPWLLLQQTRRGTIPHRRVGRRIVYSRQRLLDWLGADTTEAMHGGGAVPPPSRRDQGQLPRA